MSDEPKAHVPYKVVSVHETQTFGPTNSLEDVLEVTFTTDRGGRYTVRVPMAAAEPGAVDRAIQEKLDTVEAIHGLGPEPHPDNLAE